MRIALVLPDAAYNSYLHGMIWGEEIDAKGLKAAFEKNSEVQCEIVTPNILKHLDERKLGMNFNAAIHFDWPTYQIKTGSNILFFQQYYNDEAIEKAHLDFHNFDYVITNSKYTADKYDNVHYFPSAVDIEKFSPGDLSRKYTSEVVFIGNTRMREPQQYKRYLFPASSFDLKIYGTGWDAELFNEYHPFYDGAISFDEMIDVYRSTKIALCIHNSRYIEPYGLITNRIFHTIAVGIVLISDKHPVMMDTFPEGAGVIYTDGYNHTKEIINELLNNPQRYNEIVNKGRQVLYENHTWSKRVEFLSSMF